MSDLKTHIRKPVISRATDGRNIILPTTSPEFPSGRPFSSEKQSLLVMWVSAAPKLLQRRAKEKNKNSLLPGNQSWRNGGEEER